MATATEQKMRKWKLGENPENSKIVLLKEKTNSKTFE